ncbi:MAG: hypothetical protein WDN48_08100 [Pseudolabrys sp.]
MDNQEFETFLARALKRQADAARPDDAAVDRAFQRLSGPLPKQKKPFWRLPDVLLDWQFAPAWPRVAALACCAVLGFMIGIAGIDRNYEMTGSPFSVGDRADLGSVVFEPEPLTGARP